MTLLSHVEPIIAFFNTNTISSMTTYIYQIQIYVKPRPVSGNSVVSSGTVSITLLNSENVPTMRSIPISQILVLPDITDVKVLSVYQLLLCPHQFPRFTTVLPTLHTFTTTLIAPPTFIISDSTDRDHGIAPMIAESRQMSRPWRVV